MVVLLENPNRLLQEDIPDDEWDNYCHRCGDFACSCWQIDSTTTYTKTETAETVASAVEVETDSLVLADYLRDLLPHHSAHRDDQLRDAILTTKRIDDLIVWRCNGNFVLIDGYRRWPIWLGLSAEERKGIAPPKFREVVCANRAQAKALRYQLRDAGHCDGWDDDARARTILGDDELRAEVLRISRENQLGGVRVAPASKGDWCYRLAKFAQVAGDKIIQWAKILNSANRETYLAAIGLGEMSATEAASRITRGEQDAIAVIATTRALPAPPATRCPLDTIIHGDAFEMLKRIDGELVQLTVTSPGFPHQKLWEAYGEPYPGYRWWLDYQRRIAEQEYRVTRDSGIVLIDIDDMTVPPDEGEAETPPVLRRDCYGDLMRLYIDAGFRWRDTFIWFKQNCVCDRPMKGGSLSPRANYCYEHLLVLQKGSRGLDIDRMDMTVLNDERDKWVMGGFWAFCPQNNKPTPYPYPEELPFRAIQLYTGIGQVVLDPFVGSGTTAAVAKKLGRHFIGIERAAETWKYAATRVDSVQRGDEVIRATPFFLYSNSTEKKLAARRMKARQNRRKQSRG